MGSTASRSRVKGKIPPLSRRRLGGGWGPRNDPIPTPALPLKGRETSVSLALRGSRFAVRVSLFAFRGSLFAAYSSEAIPSGIGATRQSALGLPDIHLAWLGRIGNTVPKAMVASYSYAALLDRVA